MGFAELYPSYKLTIPLSRTNAVAPVVPARG